VEKYTERRKRADKALAKDFDQGTRSSRLA
jgi:hypothetical protein